MTARKRMPRKRASSAKASRTPTVQKREHAKARPAARLMPRTQAVVFDHDDFDGKEVDFIEGRLIVRSEKLRRAIVAALQGGKGRRGSHSAMIRFVKEGSGQVKQGDPDVVVDARC